MAQMSGADADALDRLGLQMEQAGRRLAANSKRLRRQINDSPWTGRNADRFRQEYNTLHTRSIAEAARFLDDAYETLSRNARQQREASGQKPGSGLSIWDQIKRWWPPTWLPRLPWWGGRAEFLPMPFYRLPFPRLPFPWPYRPLPLPYLLPGFWRPPAVPVIPKDWITDIFIGLGIIGVATAPGGPATPGGTPKNSGPTPAPAPPSAPPAAGPGSATGKLPGSDRSIAEVDAAYRAGMKGYYGPTGPSAYQCTAWANFRWKELGYTGGDIGGHGWAMAANAPGPVTGNPSLGAMLSYGNGEAGSYGHVAIVEEIVRGADGSERVRISEMNVGDTNYEVGTASEYRSDRWLVRSGSGWKYEGGRSVGDVRFAALPK